MDTHTTHTTHTTHSLSTNTQLDSIEKKTHTGHKLTTCSCSSPSVSAVVRSATWLSWGPACWYSFPFPVIGVIIGVGFSSLIIGFGLRGVCISVQNNRSLLYILTYSIPTYFVMVYNTVCTNKARCTFRISTTQKRYVKMKMKYPHWIGWVQEVIKLLDLVFQTT